MKLKITFILIISTAISLHAQVVINVPGNHSTIQAGINAAIDGDTVLVAEGEYLENIRFNGKAITLASQFIMDGDTSHISRTIINGSQPTKPDSASVVIFGNGEDSTSVLCGFTITGGTGTLYLHPTFGFKRVGGGILTLENSGGKIENNIIRHNTMEYPYEIWGGGICILFGPEGDKNFVNSVIIQHNTIRNNSVISSYKEFGSSGGGIKVAVGNELMYGKIIIQNNIIRNNEVRNTASGGSSIGGGMNFGMFLPTPPGEYIIRNNVFSYNKATGTGSSRGGGMIIIYMHVLNEDYFDSVPAPLIYNNIIHHNEASTFAGGIATRITLVVPLTDFYTVAQPLIINNTIVDNKSHWAVGAYSNYGTPLLVNNILWNDLSATDTTTEIGYFGDFFWAFNNCIQGGYGTPDLNNISQDPRFLGVGGYAIDWDSPCNGAGLDSFPVVDTRKVPDTTWYSAPGYDIWYHARPDPDTTSVDIGAFESIYPLPPPNAIYKIQAARNEILIFPNPMTNQITVRASDGARLRQVELIDITGRTIRTINNIQSDQIILSRGNLSNGIYLLRIHTTKVFTAKVLVK